MLAVNEAAVIAGEIVVVMDIESLTPISDLPDFAQAPRPITVELEASLPPPPELVLASRFDEPSAESAVLASEPAVAAPADDVAVAETAAAPAVELTVETVTAAAVEHPIGAAVVTAPAILLAEDAAETA